MQSLIHSLRVPTSRSSGSLLRQLPACTSPTSYSYSSYPYSTITTKTSIQTTTTRTSTSTSSRTTRRPTTRTQPQFQLQFQPQSQRHLSTEVRTAISRAIATAPVVLFMKGTPETPQCGFSRTTIQILGLQGVDPAKFTAFNVLEDPELRSGIKEYSDWPTIPQLYVDGDFVGGCDIVMQMHRDGSLADLLAEKKVIITAEEEEEPAPAAAAAAPADEQQEQRPSQSSDGQDKKSA